MDDLIRIGNQRDILGECPIWDYQAGVLWWVDIRKPAIRRLEAETGIIKTWNMPELIGAIALTEGSDLIIALGNKVSLWNPDDGFLRTLAQTPYIDGHRFNDGKVDREGRFWVSTMHNTTRAPEGTLYRLDDSGLVAILTGISIPNSLAWSPDGSKMYFADSLKHRIDIYDVRGSTIGPAQQFALFSPPAFPDGATVDVEGCLWVAEFKGSRVVRHSPNGQIVDIVEIPTDRPTACALGGPDLRTLYVTTTSQNMDDEEQAADPLAGALLAKHVEIPGVPEPRAVFLKDTK